MAWESEQIYRSDIAALSYVERHGFDVTRPLSREEAAKIGCREGSLIVLRRCGCFRPQSQELSDLPVRPLVLSNIGRLLLGRARTRLNEKYWRVRHSTMNVNTKFSIKAEITSDEEQALEYERRKAS